MKKKIILSVAATAILLSVGSIVAFAAEGYSYLNGQQRSQTRNDIYAQAELIEDEEERNAFLNENSIGDIEWSEEAAASFSYVAGRQRGSSFRSEPDGTNENSDMTSYGCVTGQQRGSSYHR